MQIKPVALIFNSSSEAHDFYNEFMGQCSLPEANIVVCRTASCIEAAKRMGGTVVPNYVQN